MALKKPLIKVKRKSPNLSACTRAVRNSCSKGNIDRNKSRSRQDIGYIPRSICEKLPEMLSIKLVAAMKNCGAEEGGT